MPEQFLGFDVQTLATGMSIAILGLLTALGRLSVKWKKPAQQQVEIAGAIIDKKAAQELMAGFEAVALALCENTRASRETSTGIAAIIGEMRALRDEARETNQRLEQVKDAIKDLPHR